MREKNGFKVAGFCGLRDYNGAKVKSQESVAALGNTENDPADYVRLPPFHFEVVDKFTKAAQTADRHIHKHKLNLNAISRAAQLAS